MARRNYMSRNYKNAPDTCLVTEGRLDALSHCQRQKRSYTLIKEQNIGENGISTKTDLDSDQWPKY